MTGMFFFQGSCQEQVTDWWAFALPNMEKPPPTSLKATGWGGWKNSSEISRQCLKGSPRHPQRYAQAPDDTIHYNEGGTFLCAYLTSNTLCLFAQSLRKVYRCHRVL